MNWLNKIDEILDRFLPPPPSNESVDADDVSNHKHVQGAQEVQEEKSNQGENNPNESLLYKEFSKSNEEKQMRMIDAPVMGSSPSRLSDSSRKLPGMIIKSKRRPRSEQPKSGTSQTIDNKTDDWSNMPLDDQYHSSNLLGGKLIQEQDVSSEHVVETVESHCIQEQPPLHTSDPKDNVENTSNNILHQDSLTLSFNADPPVSSPVIAHEEEDKLDNILSSSPFTNCTPVPSPELVENEESTTKNDSIDSLSLAISPPISSVSILEEDDEKKKDTQHWNVDQKPTQQSSSSTLNHPHSSSETMEDTNSSSSFTLDYVRSQAISLRAAMGDFDYGYEPNKDEEPDEDSNSNITEEEGDDYNYGNHILSWNMDLDQENCLNGPFFQSSSDSFPLNPLQNEFHPSMNCHGVFHIRLIRAQHLPCAPKTTIQTIISLPPWKGKIRSLSGQTYKGPSKAGTCFRWQSPTVDPHLIEPPCFSMIHTYNNEETPVPSITVQIKDVSYPMFEKELLSLTLSCKTLMKSPFTWRRRWCMADSHKVRDDSKRKLDLNVENDHGLSMADPMILLEAIFEPSNFSDPHTNTQLAILDDESCTGTVDSIGQDMYGLELESPTRRNVTFSETSSVSSSTATLPSLNIMRRGLSSTPHLFRIVSSWRPGYCGVCSTTTGLWNRYYQCETCGLDCCSDCQLRVDLDLPCGSEAANLKVNQAKDSKITLRRVMAILAPIHEEDPSKIRELVDTSSKEALSHSIGTLKLKVQRALLFQKSFPAQVEIVDLYKMKDRWSRLGDYYVRVSWSDSSGDSKRTKTVFQTSNPIFESDEMVIPVMTYGTEYLIEAIDANTDKAVGSTLLSTQGILQWQRDQSVFDEGVQLKSFRAYPTSATTIKRTVELRVPWKNGFGLDFYKTGNINDTIQAGEITGLVDIDLSLQENASLFSFTNPKGCPERPISDFHIDLIQIHIARIKALIDDIYALLDAYYFLVSWDNRALTSLSLLIFVTTCLTLKAEYIGSVPVFILLITMIHLRRIRARGDFMMRWIKKEVKMRKGQSNIAESKTSIFRPMATLEVGVSQGQNLISQHGLPGSAVVQVLLDPTAFLDDKKKKNMKEIDVSTRCTYHFGDTESCGVTSAPRWKNLLLSEECERLQQFLPGYNIVGDVQMNEKSKTVEFCEETIDEDPKLSFPVLQPITTSPIKRYDRDGNVLDSMTIELVPWENSPAGLIFRVRFSDVLNRSLFEEKLGDVIIPLKDLALKGEIQGWFEVMNRHSKSLALSSDSKQNDREIASLKMDDVDRDRNRSGIPMLFVTAKLTVPVIKPPSDVEKETSIAIDEEYIRSSYQILNPRLGIIESSINTLTSVRGVGENVLYLQNQLGYVLDLFEMTRNLFNFSCPEKSMLLLAVLLAAWLILLLIPTRLVILCIGLSQYASTFMTAFFKNESPQTLSTDSIDESPFVTWLMNFLYSTPTDEDLRRCYFWETRRHAEQELAKISSIRRSARLTKVWKSSWFGSLEMRKDVNVVGHHVLEWENVFAVIIGHRFIWWKSEKHFDQGELPIGKILFSGHSGLAGLSPLEMRLLRNVDLSHIVSIFGRGDTDQVKVTLMVSDQSSRENLEKAVLQACLYSKVD